MLKFRVKWRVAFASLEVLNTAFGDQQTCVVPGPFGEVLWIRVKNEIHAYKNKCPHQNKPLTDCWLEENHIVCPFHQYHFDIENGRGHQTSMYKYEVKTEDNKVWIGKEVLHLFG